MREYYDLLRSTSRTFAVGIEALPRELRDAVTLAYLVLRVSDYFEDSPTLSDSRKQSSLEEWGRLLDSGSAPVPALEAAAALAAGVAPEDRTLPDFRAAGMAAGILGRVAALPPATQGIVRRHTTATTRGMAEWIARGADFPDEAALDAYMFEVAGRVGLLLTDLFLEAYPALRAREGALRDAAVPFGLGLQTVNILRGLHEDPQRGWTYLPRTLLPGEWESGPLHSLPQDRRQAILDFLVRKAGRHIVDGFRYCALLPRGARGIRIFCIVPALIAARTAEAARGDLELFRAPVRIGRAEVGRLILRSRILYFSNGWLEREGERALRIAG